MASLWCGSSFVYPPRYEAHNQSIPSTRPSQPRMNEVAPLLFKRSMAYPQVLDIFRHLYQGQLVALFTLYRTKLISAFMFQPLAVLGFCKLVMTADSFSFCLPFTTQEKACVVQTRSCNRTHNSPFREMDEKPNPKISEECPLYDKLGMIWKSRRLSGRSPTLELFPCGLLKCWASIPSILHKRQFCGSPDLNVFGVADGNPRS